MKVIQSKYGTLKGISSAEFYENGALKECMVAERNVLITPYGQLIPWYEEDHVRRKYTASVTFYKNGNIRSILLNNRAEIITSLGLFEVEKITFYEDESLKRIFPLDGKLTGYWTEDNEYELAKEYTLKLSVGEIKSKIMSLQFYRSQKLRSITLWPKEKVLIQLEIGTIPVRTGISFYESGQIKSCEPAKPTPIKTPIGKMIAYDTSAIGIHGDSNSLQFYEDGKLKALITSTDQIEIYDENNQKTCYAPQEISSLLHFDGKDIVPLKIAFYQGRVSINEELEYAQHSYSFSIINYFRQVQAICTDCSNCNLCH